MDSRRCSANESGHKACPSISSALVSAVLEWMLMFMIFVDATFAYLVTKFARHHELRTPCLLCSRLDHVLGDETTGFCWSLICHQHKSEISSLILCQLHNNLVDVHAICESCFCSFDSSDDNIGLSSKRKCACCNEQWVSRTCTQRFQRKSIDNEGADHDAPSSISQADSGDSVWKITEKSTQLEQMRSNDTDSLPCVEYSQIKDTSDSESEGLSSDNGSATALIREMETSVQESVAEFVSAEPEIVILDHSPAPEKLIHPDPPIRSLPSESENHTLEELNRQKCGSSRDFTGPSELIYFSDVHASPIPDETHSVDSQQTSDATIVVELEKGVRVERRETSTPQIDSTCTDESSKQVRTECRENSGAGSDSIPRNEMQMDLKPDKTETSSQMAGPVDLGDAYRLAIGARGRQLSGKLEQQRSVTDRVSEDLKLLLSQISSARGLDFLSADISPRVSASTEDFKAVDASSATGLQVFSRRISLERNESNISLDGSSVSEIEGESEVDRLKRQVEHDKKILHTLYKELEEERSASAIAANQAMAMITRLQEEKAAFHMEALQCVRMMEEQAEYDGEALQRANALLAEKEKQIQDFQFELDIYRNGFGDAPSSNKFVVTDEVKEQILEANCGNNYSAASSDSDKYDIVKRVDGAPEISSNRFEDEKQYISECLKTLEEKLFVLNKSEVLSQENGGTETNRLKRDELMPKDPSGHDISQHEKEEYGGDAELAALRHQLSAINNRLEAIEVEQSVIECSINALEKGSQGFAFIQEIAARLHELRRAQHEDYMSP